VAIDVVWWVGRRRGCGDEGFGGVGPGVGGAGEEVALDVAGDVDGAVTEALGDEGERDAGGELEAGGQVA
jgi:hypothetical protein